MLYLNYKFTKNSLKLDIEIELPTSNIIALFGNSGAGKTTILRIIAGLEPNYQGILKFNDQIWQDDKIFRPPHLRKIGYVFQDSRLFNHISVAKNLAFASKRSAIKKTAIEQIISDLDLEKLLPRMPYKLSGGEKQRVAFARGLLTNPELLLLDEPFNAIDNYSTQLLIEYTKKLSIPTLYVSHDQKEVMKIADYLVHIEKGKLTKHGSINQMLTILGRNGFIIAGNLIDASNGQCVYQTSIGVISFSIFKTAPTYAHIFIDSRHIVIHQDNLANSLPVHVNKIYTIDAFYSSLDLSILHEKIIITISQEKLKNLSIKIGQIVFIETLHADIL